MSLPHSVTQLHQGMTNEPASDGLPAKLFTLTNRMGMTATFMDIGATWLSCTLPVEKEHRNVLLNAKSMHAHRQQTAFLGATIGRYANRIANSQFTINGSQYLLQANQDTHCLHGGLDGFDKRRWQVSQESASSLSFTLFSQDGDQGFPGNLTADVRFELTEDNSVLISYQADCDKDCPVNLTNHAYFNLDGDESDKSCLEHSMQLQASHYLRTDEDLLPTGELVKTKGSNFDFVNEKRIGEHFLADNDQQIAGGYDHAFLLDPQFTDGKHTVAKVISADTKVTMLVKTSKPSVQLYTGNYLAGTPTADGEYKRYQGFALETQYLPDAPNQQQFQQDKAILPAHQKYQHHTRYQFQFHR